MVAWPTGQIDTTNLDAGTDSPASARSDLKSAIDMLNDAQAARGDVNGVASLGADGKIPVGQIPTIPITQGGTGANNTSQARINLGITNASGKLSIPLFFPGTGILPGTANDFQKVRYWLNETGFTFNIENLVITGCTLSPDGDALYSMAVLANPNASDGSGNSVVNDNSNPQSALAVYNTLLKAGEYQGSWYRTSTKVAGSLLKISSGQAVSVYPLSFSGSPPENIILHLEGYLG